MSGRDNRTDGSELRGRAERRLQDHLASVAAHTDLDPSRLLHELEVHEVELEIQNEELIERRAELEAALARYTELFDLAPTGYVAIDPDGTMQAANHAATRLLRGTRGQIVGTRLGIYVHEHDRRFFNETVERVLSKRAEARHPQACELTVVSEHDTREVRMTMTAINAEQTVLVAIEDITAWKHAEELRARQVAREQVLAATRRDLDATQRLQEIGTLFLPDRTPPDVVFGKMVEAALAITDADFADLQMVDRRTGESIVRAQRGFAPWWAEFWDSADGVGARGAALHRGERVIIEDIDQSELEEARVVEIKHRAGVRAVMATPLMSRSGRPLGTITVYFRRPHRPDDRALRWIDVLSRQAADLIERANADETEAMLRRRFEALDQVSFLLNELVIERRGEPLSEDVLAGLADIARSVTAAAQGAVVSPDSGEGPSDPLRLAARAIAGSGERSVQHRDADVTVLASAIRDHGRLVGCLCVAKPRADGDLDADDRTTLELLADRIGVGFASVRLTRATLDAVRARENLLAIVSHDLRGPLSTIRLCSSILARDGANARPIDSINSSTDRMNRLIEDLLQAASIEAGKFTVEPVREEVLPLLRDAIDAHAPLAAARSIELELDVAPELPDIRADRVRLQQVLSNLIGNAIKFVGKGGRVQLRAWCELDGLHVAVSDNGPGIPDHDLARIFERYERATTQGPLGVGLGLYISKAIIEAHGGRIWVDSRVGAGTTFYFTIPLARDR